MSFELIKELCDTPGVPGVETRISEIVLREIKNLCFTSFKDPMGNLIFQVNKTIDNAPTILVDAHMDEVGFIISHIEENGMFETMSAAANRSERLAILAAPRSRKSSSVIYGS